MQESTMDDVRAALSDIWSEVLDKKPAGDDSFFELGGGSMELVMLLMSVQDRFGVDMSIDDIFTETFTFEESVNALFQALRTEEPHDAHVPTGGTQ